MERMDEGRLNKGARRTDMEGDKGGVDLTGDGLKLGN